MTTNLSPPNGDQVGVGRTPEPDSAELQEKIQNDLMDLETEEKEQILNSEEKRYLLYVERGDVASVRHIMKKGIKENEKKPGSFNINCLDPLGRSSLIIAIENENDEMINLLLENGVEAADSLLHAISEEYVEGVEILLIFEEKVHVPDTQYSWQTTRGERAFFTPDITPLILAAHRNNYEILKLLLDRGASLPMPHDVKCACDDCLFANEEDSLSHSLARINAYRALASPSLMCLSSMDPFVTAFKLSQDLDNLSSLENEFSEAYSTLREQVQDFAMALVEETKTSMELEIILNYDPDGEPYKKGEFMNFTLLKEAVGNNQKQFVAHANVQQLLGTVWYDGMPGFKRRSPIAQCTQIAKIGAMFPAYCLAFIASPTSKMASDLKKPFIKFIVQMSSYCVFLTLLVVVSLRVGTFMIELFGNEWMLENLRRQERESRGGWPTFVELLIVTYIFGFIWGEVQTLWEDGLASYIKDLKNFVDFGANFFYMNWIFLRLTAIFLSQRAVLSGENPYYPREMWPPFDPMLLSEAMFCAGNILSFMKLIDVFSINHHMGPLQIALGRMVVDIIKFFFIYSLVLFAFGCGLNNLLGYYADIDKERCYSGPGGTTNPAEGRSCGIWRRFSNLFETSQSLFWASFGLVDLTNFELTGIKSFTRFWSMLMYGSYNVINVIVLLNLLIAMMSNSYTIIVEKCDVEWKFARSKLWMSYFDEGDELPSPFNLIPNFHALFKKTSVTRESVKYKKDNLRDSQYQGVMRNLVRRYVTAEQQKHDDNPIREDDINEVKKDISSFKYEILNILKINGMTTGNKHQVDTGVVGRKQQMRERRLMKGFNIGIVEGIDAADVIAHLILTSTGMDKSIAHKLSKSIKRKDPIGSSSTSITRQSMRQNARESAKTWDAVKFYQRRGVFTGGEINDRMLTEVKSRDPAAKAKPVQSRCRGWRAAQAKHQERLAAKEAAERGSPAPATPEKDPSPKAKEQSPPSIKVDVPSSDKSAKPDTGSKKPASAAKKSTEAPKPPSSVTNSAEVHKAPSSSAKPKAASPTEKPAEKAKPPAAKDPKPAEKPAEKPKPPSPAKDPKPEEKPADKPKPPSPAKDPKPPPEPKPPTPKPAEEPKVIPAPKTFAPPGQRKGGWL